MRDVDVGIVGLNAVQYTAATPSVTMSGNSLLSVQGIVAYAGVNVGMAAVRIDGAARISVMSSGSVVGPFEAINGSTVEQVAIDNAGRIMGGTAPILLTVGSLQPRQHRRDRADRQPGVERRRGDRDDGTFDHHHCRRDRRDRRGDFRGWNGEPAAREHRHDKRRHVCGFRLGQA
jgi:hypothetical protein